MTIDTSRSSTCGNSLRETGEECDDGNTISGDGCSASCYIEYGWTCVGGSTTSKDTCYKYKYSSSSSSTCNAIT